MKGRLSRKFEQKIAVNLIFLHLMRSPWQMIPPSYSAKPKPKAKSEKAANAKSAVAAAKRNETGKK